MSIEHNGKKVYGSCAVTHENRQYIFGGADFDHGKANNQQVLMLIDCRLNAIAELRFNHVYGACGSSNGIIVLCFDSSSSKLCREAVTPVGPWSKKDSIYKHRYTSIALSNGRLN